MKRKLILTDDEEEEDSVLKGKTSVASAVNDFDDEEEDGRQRSAGEVLRMSDDEVNPVGIPKRHRELNKEAIMALPACQSAVTAGDCVYNEGEANEIPSAQATIVLPGTSNDELDFEVFHSVDNYAAEKDNYVIETDTPERMQMLEEITGRPPVDEKSIEEESEWIIGQLAAGAFPFFCNSRDLLNRVKKADIASFLKLYHVEKFDIPFIAMYRKEKCLSLLEVAEDLEHDEAENNCNDNVKRPCQLKWHKVLWVIAELDKKWLLLQNRKNSFHMLYNKCYGEQYQNAGGEAEFSLNNVQLFMSIEESLKKAESEAEIDDVDMKFTLHFPPVKWNGVKRCNRNSLYSKCKKAGLWKLAAQFGYNSKQICLEKTGTGFVEDPDESPKVIASKYTCAMFENTEAVLKGARQMAALQISCEPCIRKHVRGVFMEEAVVSTCPTPKGSVAIDSFNRFAGIKWLHEKPVLKFKDAQWLLIQKAEEENLLQVTIKLPDSVLNKLHADVNGLYSIDGVGRSASLWDEQRNLILQYVFSIFLLPKMEKEARDLLTARAKKWLLMEYGKQFWNMVSVAPYEQVEYISGSEKSDAARVMACCWGPGKPETTFVMLDSEGELVDVSNAGSLYLRPQDVLAQQKRKNSEQRIFKFIMNHKPRVIVIGAVNVFCIQLKDDIKEIVSKAEEKLRDNGQAMDEIHVVLGDESLALLYENSQISSDQLPREPDIVKRAVGVGRFFQNPLAMVSNLCGPTREIVSWKLGPLDEFLMPDEKYEMITQVMVDITNQVGVDINNAVRHDWYFPLLQFVSGLGPRKAAFLQKQIGGRVVRNRKMLASAGLGTGKVFYNAIGFLRVRVPLWSTKDIHLLDDTRIHPESYWLAKTLADALCSDVAEEEAIEYVKNNPEMLNAFDMNDFADSYEILGSENARETLYDIKMELLHGFVDPREPYKEDEEFTMVSGKKNGDGLAEGRIVEAKVRHVQARRAFCSLDFRWTGILMKDDFCDESGVFSLEEKLHVGDKIRCMVKEIDKSRFQAYLTRKRSDMKRYIYEVDPYYREGDPEILYGAIKRLGEKHLHSK